jgi:hypothetical protein
MDHPTPNSRIVNGGHCAHLRHKGMYVLSAADPNAVPFFDDYEATAYWCTCTQKGLGPDGQPARADRCRQGAGRGCCEQ